MNFTLNTEQLNQIFPYYLVFDENFSFTSCSTKISEFIGPINGRSFSDIFLIKNISKKDLGKDISSKLISETFSLQFISNPEIQLSGTLEYFGEKNHAIFYGDLQVKSSTVLNNKNLVSKNASEKLDKLAIGQLIIDEKRYRDLYSYSPALIYAHTLDGKLLSCNPAAQSILGYKEEDIIGVNIENFLPAFDRMHFQTDYLDKVIIDGKSKGVFRILPKNGDKILYLYYQNYKVQESDYTSYIIGFSQDITDRVKVEKELRFAKLTSENLAKQKEFFLANMSHEIRTPINGILGLNNLLLKTNLDEKQEHYVKLSSESINNLLILINDILDTEKIGFGKIGFESHPFNISHKVVRTIQLFQHKAKEAGLEIFFNDNISKDMVVRGDQYRFTQILSNLISNAVKFTKVGSITVSASTLHDNDDTVEVEFSVKDTGIGVSEKNISEIFKPFVQASFSTTRTYGGTGLGLSICKKLIEMQGGSIKVKSKLGEGTEFTFTLTYEKNPGNIVIENQQADIDPAKLKGTRVLVGEDVELNQFLIKNILESWGCEIDMVDNGIKIIKKLEQNDYDIILMDIQMPEMDGLASAKHIRGMKDLQKANIPIVAFTAGAMKGDIQSYKSVEMNDFILKPYSEKHLYDKLISVLELGDTDTDGQNTTNDNKQQVLAAEGAPYNLSSIRALSKTDDVLFNKVLNILIIMLSAEKDNIKSFAKEKNWKEVAEIVHKIKTSLVHIHVDSLTEIIKNLERYENYNDEQLGEFTNELCDSLDNILVFLKIDLVSSMNKN